MFVKQAVGYINFRVIYLSEEDKSFRVQNRYGSVNALQKAVEGIKSRKTRKSALGSEYDRKNILINIEDICVAKEYGNYIKRIFGEHEEIIIRFGSKVDTVVKENKIFDIVKNQTLALDYIEKDEVLQLGRLAIKKKYDSMFSRNVNTTAVKKARKEDYEKRLGKVLEFAKKNSLYFQKSDYQNIHKEIEWCCGKCDSVFTVSFKRIKDRKTACTYCSDAKRKKALKAN